MTSDQQQAPSATIATPTDREIHREAARASGFPPCGFTQRNSAASRAS